MRYAFLTEMPVNHQGSPRFELLDGLRGIAALLVLFAHACSAAGATQFFEKKYLAVYFFFMLSGFVVACAYDKRLKAGMPVMQFYLRRAIRLYPLLIAGTILCAIYLFFLIPQFRNDPTRELTVLVSLLGLPFQYAHFTTIAFPINPPEWSLFYELLAYLVYGITAMHLRTWHLVTTAILSLILFSFGAHYYTGEEMGLIAKTFTASAPFSIGIILWRIYEKKSIRIPAIPFWALSLIMIALCALPDRFDRGFDALIVLAFFPVMILCGAAHGGKNSGSLIRILGDLSYPVYILHWPFIIVAPHIFSTSANRIAIASLSSFASVVYAWFAFRFYDVPLRRYLSRVLIPKRKEPTSTPEKLAA